MLLLKSRRIFPYILSSVQSLSRVWLSVTPWTAAHQASLSITNSQSFLKLMSVKSVMPSNHLILCHPLILPSVFPHIRGFSSESILIRWPKYWSFSFSISPSNEYSGLISFRINWFWSPSSPRDSHLTLSLNMMFQILKKKKQAGITRDFNISIQNCVIHA